jgi:hypothetical protein
VGGGDGAGLPGGAGLADRVEGDDRVAAAEALDVLVPGQGAAAGAGQEHDGRAVGAAGAVGDGLAVAGGDRDRVGRLGPEPGERVAVDGVESFAGAVVGEVADLVDSLHDTTVP